MKINKLIISLLFINLYSLNYSMEEKPKSVCKDAVICDFTTAIRKKYAEQGVDGAPSSWLTPKQEIKTDAMHNEVIALVSRLPFPLTDKNGEPIFVTFNVKTGRPTIEVKNSPDYLAAKQVLEQFNGPIRLDKAQRIIQKHGTLNLPFMYETLNQPYCSQCHNN